MERLPSVSEPTGPRPVNSCPLRAAPKKKGEFYRMNMPFELGVDIGSKLFSKEHADKTVLIIAEEPLHHQIGLSDLPNSDIRYHKSEAETLAMS